MGGRALGPGDRRDDAGAIVVLGARVLKGGLPGGALRARVERAVALYSEGAAPLLIFTGGVVGHPPSEASVGRELAVSLGVPREVCLIEEESRSTLENARHSSRLLRGRGITRVLLVSDPYHLYRARRAFWLHGVDAIPVPALLTGRNIPVWQRAWWSAREIFALLLRPSLFFVRRPK